MKQLGHPFLIDPETPEQRHRRWSVLVIYWAAVALLVALAAIVMGSVVAWGGELAMLKGWIR